MRRWNGWGDSEIEYPLPEGARGFLTRALGKGRPLPDASMEEAIGRLSPSRLEALNGVTTDAVERLLHARGQSLPDWIALRSGQIGPAPDGVAYPTNAEQIRRLLAWAVQKRLQVIPYGGGTSVVGHINPIQGSAPVLTLDLSRLQRMLDLDRISRLARFEAGITGPALEGQLNQRGFTLGHFPQSWEHSTLGGWIATRSSGQQSYRYGRIEDLFAGGSLETPGGTLNLPCFPASAAGPDLRQVVLGSEGRLGVLTEAVVRVRPVPERELFLGIFFHSWEDGLAAARELVQDDMPLSMLRLSDGQETETTLALAGREKLVGVFRTALNMLGYGERRALMILGLSGPGTEVGQTRARTLELVRRFGGLNAGALIGEQWRRSRFKSPYLRNTLWELGYALDTLETALPWSLFDPARRQALDAIRKSFDGLSLRSLVFSHLSHVYQDGASFYLTYLYPRQESPDATLAVWRSVKAAASESILASGGTISHQHGVGLDHRQHLQVEKGELGLKMLRSLAQTLDPMGLLNPGKLFESDLSDPS